MTQAILTFVLLAAAAALALAAGFVFNWYVAVVTAVALAVLIGWYFADNGPVLGPSDTRVTFKQHLIGLMIAVRDVLGLDKLWAWLVSVWTFCGAQLGAAILALDAFVAATPEVKTAITSSDYGLYILLALNFVAFFARGRAIASQ